MTTGARCPWARSGEGARNLSVNVNSVQSVTSPNRKPVRPQRTLGRGSRFIRRKRQAKEKMPHALRKATACSLHLPCFTGRNSSVGALSGRANGPAKGVKFCLTAGVV